MAARAAKVAARAAKVGGPVGLTSVSKDITKCAGLAASGAPHCISEYQTLGYSYRASGLYDDEFAAGDALIARIAARNGGGGGGADSSSSSSSSSRAAGGGGGGGGGVGNMK